jgi:hypothetical protein
MIVLQSPGVSPEVCGKLATFHVVAGDTIPGYCHPMLSRPKGAPDIRPSPSHGSHPHEPPHLDSGHPKSTLDLGIQTLIWGDNALPGLPISGLGRSKRFRIQANLKAFWNQTKIKPNQAAKLFPTVDLGCLKSSCPSSLKGLYIRVRPWLKTVLLQNEPNFAPRHGSTKSNHRPGIVHPGPSLSNPVQPSPTLFEKKMNAPGSNLASCNDRSPDRQPQPLRSLRLCGKNKKLQTNPIPNNHNQF